MSTTTIDASSRTVLDRVQALEPRVRAALEEMDRERRLPADVATALAEAGLFRLGVPKVLGGDECEPATLVRTIEAVACIDGSVG
jgi:alkylation response protein AidB-like acyl-CoA dehydrogenase